MQEQIYKNQQSVHFYSNYIPNFSNQDGTHFGYKQILKAAE